MDASMLIAAPEILVLIMACVVLVVDTFLDEGRRGIIHMLGMLTLVFAAIITLRHDPIVEGQPVVTAFNDMFIRDAMGDTLKLFAYATLGLIFIYAKQMGKIDRQYDVHED